MYGMMYASTFGEGTGATIAAVQDLWQIEAAAGVPIVIHAIYLGQEDLTANDQMKILIHRGTGDVLSGTAPEPLNPSNTVAARGTYVLNDTTQLTDTGAAYVHADAFSVLDGWVYLPPPEDRILIPGGGKLAIESAIAVTSGTWTGTLIVEEIG